MRDGTGMSWYARFSWCFQTPGIWIFGTVTSLAIAIIQQIRNTCVRQSPYLKFDQEGDLGGHNSGIHFLRQSSKKT